ncbi:hypothetical protein [Methylotenera sp. 1P/1]|uniref:hypothetical protein n=1 Tax=Methylotenera sp. 1P/1 TaxID=1131551 RepID=UPI000374BDB2|nr:hypothetical protein [Methylotenera sp. 1P/1]
MTKRNEVLNYLIQTYYKSDVSLASDITGCSVTQINDWLTGEIQPRKDTIDYFIHCVFTPEFKVIIEYGLFNQDKNVLTQIKDLLKGHEKSAGIYAFYDSAANLIYLGKASNLLTEIYDAIRREVHVAFPKGVENKPNKRHEIVRYISAYDVGKSLWVDYPKHVESLILRISKPLLNKNIGGLQKVLVAPD